MATTVPDPMTGAPMSAYADDQFVMVRFTAVDELGDYNTAGVFQRIAWRCQTTGTWTISYRDLADEVHLTYKQVRRAIDALRERGWIDAERTDDRDATLTYRVLWRAEEPSAPQGMGSAPEGTTPLPLRASPSMRQIEDKDTPLQAPQGADAPIASLGVPDVVTEFDRWWSMYPRKVGKTAALKAFEKAVKRAGSVQPIIDGLIVQLGALKQATDRDGGNFCPHPTTWLNQGRWEDDVPTPVESTTKGYGHNHFLDIARRGLEAQGHEIDAPPDRYDDGEYRHDYGVYR